MGKKPTSFVCEISKNYYLFAAVFGEAGDRIFIHFNLTIEL